MTDFSEAIDRSVFDRLTDQVTLAQVFQHVPQNTAPPVVVIADQFPEEIGDKDGSFERIEFEVAQIVRGPGRKPLNALQRQVKDSLHLWTPPIVTIDGDDVALAQIVHVSSSGQLLEDGDHYYGSMRFMTYAQRA